MSMTIEDIDAQILKQRVACDDSIRALMSSRNALVGICRLPVEVLCSIFLAVSRRPSVAALLVSQVCTLWRSVALSCPYLWTDIINPPRYRRDWLMEKLRRSKHAPLTVDLDIPRYASSVVENALRHLYHIAELTVRSDTFGTHTILREQVIPFLTQPAPLLRVVRLSLEGRIDRIVTLPKNIFAGHAPCLRQFAVQHCRLDLGSSLFHHLTELEVKREPQYPLRDILSSLSSMPTLQVLSLGNSIIPPTQTTDFSGAVQLPHLVSLSLNADEISALTGLLGGVRVPLSTRLDITLSRWVTLLDRPGMAHFLAAWNELGCGENSAQWFRRPFFAVSFCPVDLNWGLTCFEFMVWDDPDRLPAVKLSLDNRLNALSFMDALSANIPLLETSILFLRTSFAMSVNAVDHVLRRVLTLCRTVQHLILLDHTSNECCAALGDDPLDSSSESNRGTLAHLPQLRTLTIRGGTFVNGVDNLVKSLSRRMALNMVMHTLRNVSCMDDEKAEKLKGVVEVLDWDGVVPESDSSESEEDSNTSDQEY